MTCYANFGPVSPDIFRYMLLDMKNFLESECGIVINENEILLHLLWADDLVLLSDSPQGLQKQLDGLYKFVSSYQMIVNEMKTKVVIFGTSNRDYSFTFNDKTIEIVEMYKYLGCIFNSCITVRGNMFKEMIQYSSEKGSKASFATIKKYKSLGYISPKVGLHLFDTCISPILNYSSDIWFTNNSQNIETVQLKFLKFLLGVKQSTCNLAIYGETGRFPISLYQKTKVIDFWIRLETLPGNNLLKQVYTMVKIMYNNGFKTWLAKVKDILDEVNLSVYLEKENLELQDYVLIRTITKESLYGNFMNTWLKEVSLFPKMRTLLTFKTEFRLEPYLLEVKDFKLRRLLSKFRLSSHDLEIERGRYTKPLIPSTERFCKVCNKRTVEDEKHMLVECEMYDELRNEFVNKLSTHIDVTGDLFLNIMKSKCTEVLFCLCKFLEKVSHKRYLILNQNM